MRTVSGTGRPSSVLRLEEKEDDGEDKAGAESFGGSLVAGGAWRWTAARDALWIKCSVMGRGVGYRVGGLARSQAASCAGGRRALAAHLCASVRGCVSLARFPNAECLGRIGHADLSGVDGL